MITSVKNIFRKTTAIAAIASLITSVGADLAMAAGVNSNYTPTFKTEIGKISYSKPNSNTLNVTSQTKFAQAGSKNLSLGKDATMNLNSTVNSAILNLRSTGNLPSTLEGAVNVLRPDMQVSIMNDQGILMTDSFRGNFGKLFTASTAKNLTVGSDGKLTYTGVNGSGQIVNQGQINVSDNGYAVLVAPEVRNEGTINAKLGQVHLASANGFTIDVNGNGKINYLAGADLQKAIVSNTGVINAQGGIVSLRSDKAKSLADSVINLNGVINVDGMDASGIGHGAILANSYGNINSTENLRAGTIQLASAAGDISVRDLTSVNNDTANTGKAISVVAKKGKVTTGKITAINNTSGNKRALAEVEITAAKGIDITGDIDIQASSRAGGKAIINAKAGDRPLITRGAINIEAMGTRIIGENEAGGDIASEATGNFTGSSVSHAVDKDIEINAYSFHDIKTVLEYLSKNSSEQTSIGYYLKDEQGKPVAGEVLFGDLSAINFGALAEVSALDLREVGFFIIPNGGALNGSSNRVPVTFKEVAGKWVAYNEAGVALKGTDLSGSTKEYALFSDNSLNGGAIHAGDNTSVAGNYNWGKVANVLGDFNFNKTNQGTVGNVSSKATYNGNATKGTFTAGNIFVGSESQAQNSKSAATINIHSKGAINLLGDEVSAISKSYQVASANVNITSDAGNIHSASEVVAATLADSYANGEATSGVKITTGKGDITLDQLVTSEATGGTKATSNTVVSTTDGKVFANALIGAVTTTKSGTNATSTVNINGGAVNGVVFDTDAYAFTITNGVEQSGRASESQGPSKLIITESITKTVRERVATTKEVFVPGQTVFAGNNTKKIGTKKIKVVKKIQVGTKKITYKKRSSKNCCCCCGGGSSYKTVTKRVPIYKYKTGYKTVSVYKSTPIYRTTPGYTKKVTTYKMTNVKKSFPTNRIDRSGIDNYGRGVVSNAISFDPYLNVKISYNGLPPVLPPVTPPSTPKVPDYNRPDVDPAEPLFVKKEPASGGGLFCRDVNVGGIPGLCGPAPVQEPSFVAAAAPVMNDVAPAPIYAAPIKKGKSVTAKKAKVAQLEPSSGNKCLVVSGKKVCIEEQIDK